MSYSSTLAQSQASFAAREADQTKRHSNELEQEIAALRQEMDAMKRNLNGVLAQRQSLFAALASVAPAHELADKTALRRIYDANCKL